MRPVPARPVADSTDGISLSFGDNLLAIFLRSCDGKPIRLRPRRLILGGVMHKTFDREHGWERYAGALTRRQFGRMAALLTAGAALPFYNESALAQDLKAIANVPPDAVRLNTNENPLGPCPA